MIGVYFRGHATANADTMRAAFLPSAHIEGLRNGQFVSRTVDQYGRWLIANKVYHAQR